MKTIKKSFFLLLLVFMSTKGYSQIELRASLGLNMVSMLSVHDHIAFILPGANQPSTFQSSVEFGCELLHHSTIVMEDIKRKIAFLSPIIKVLRCGLNESLRIGID